MTVEEGLVSLLAIAALVLLFLGFAQALEGRPRTLRARGEWLPPALDDETEEWPEPRAFVPPVPASPSAEPPAPPRSSPFARRPAPPAHSPPDFAGPARRPTSPFGPARTLEPPATGARQERSDVSETTASAPAVERPMAWALDPPVAPPTGITEALRRAARERAPEPPTPVDAEPAGPAGAGPSPFEAALEPPLPEPAAVVPDEADRESPEYGLARAERSASTEAPDPAGPAAVADQAAALASSAGEEVAAHLRARQWAAARRAADDARGRGDVDEARGMVLDRLIGSAVKREVERLVMPAIRGARDEGRAVRALEQADGLLASLASGVLSAPQRAALERRVAWAHARLGIQRVRAGSVEAGLEALGQALGRKGLGAERLRRVRETVVEALDSLAGRAAGELDQPNGREDAVALVRDLDLHIARARALGMPARLLAPVEERAARLTGAPVGEGRLVSPRAARRSVKPGSAPPGR